LLLTEDMTLKFEGDTNDGNETTLTVTDPTADRTATLPDASGTVILDSSSVGDLSDVDTTGVSNGQVLVYNSTSSEFEPGSVGSATALIDGDSDFTLSDGVANGIHYELDNTDMADWNQGGVALTAAGGMFRHNQTQSATFTIAATEGTVLAGPITITGTVTNAGTMVIL
jgi:hypothetical protein